MERQAFFFICGSGTLIITSLGMTSLVPCPSMSYIFEINHDQCIYLFLEWSKKLLHSEFIHNQCRDESIYFPAFVNFVNPTRF